MKEEVQSSMVDDKPKKQIYIGKLAHSTTEDDLAREFGQFGDYSEMILKTGYAFITYEDSKNAEEAIKEMNGKELNGAEIVVEVAVDKREEKRARGPQPRDRCFKCGRRGHWAKFCSAKEIPKKPSGRYCSYHRGHRYERSSSGSSSSSSSRSRSRSRSPCSYRKMSSRRSESRSPREYRHSKDKRRR